MFIIGCLNIFSNLLSWCYDIKFCYIYYKLFEVRLGFKMLIIKWLGVCWCKFLKMIIWVIFFFKNKFCYRKEMLLDDYFIKRFIVRVLRWKYCINV